MNYTHNDPLLKERRRTLRKNQTDAEKALWKHIRGRQVHGLRFLRQYSIGMYILDFYCPHVQLAIELDGGQHNQEDQRDYDAERSVYLHAQGTTVMRFWNHEVHQHMDAVLMRISEWVVQKVKE